MHRVIALDGTSASGTSTAVEKLSTALGFGLLNTGSLYRLVTKLCGDRPLRELPLCLELLQGHVPVTHADGVSFGEQFVPNEDLRSLEIEAIMPRISPIDSVREIVRGWQRATAMRHTEGFVIEGRDIGTVVFPDAPLKFFFDADPTVRAERAIKRLERRGLPFKGSLEDMMCIIETRDSLDRNRENSPLIMAPDAILVDTTESTPEQTLDTLLGHVRRVLNIAA